jgi:hypothetical protein
MAEMNKNDAEVMDLNNGQIRGGMINEIKNGIS